MIIRKPFVDQYIDLVIDNQKYNDTIKLLKWNRSYSKLLRSLQVQRLSYLCTKALLSVKTPKLIYALATNSFTMPSQGGQTLRMSRYKPKLEPELTDDDSE